MKIIDRELVKRIVGIQPSSVGGGGGSDFDPSVLTGYATELWVDQNYISIEFFSRLFQAHGTENGQQTDIAPNDMDSTITSIEALFGFWTDLYISALGNGGSIGSSIYLSTLADVQLSSPATGQVLTYNATTGKWVNASPQGGVTDLASLTDVTLTTPQSNQALIYDGTKWINTTLKTVNGYSLIGSGNIDASGGGTGNYVAKAGDTMTGGLTIYTNLNNLLTLKRSSSGNGAFIDYYSGNQTSKAWRVGSSGDNTMLYAYTSNGFSSDSVYLEILTNGNIGIGTRRPTQKLDVNGNIKTHTHYFESGYINNGYNNEVDLHTVSEFRVFVHNGGEYGYAFSNWYFGPFSDGVNVVDLGRSNGRWDKIYGGLLDLYGNANGIINLKRSSNGGAFIDYFSNNQGSYGWRVGSSGDNTMLYAYTSNGFSSDSVYLEILTNGNVGIGTRTPSYKLHVSGDIYATGAVTALSDARKKDVQKGVEIGVEQIADAPAVQFLWKDEERRKEGVQVGTLAQYWQGVLPEVVMDKGGELSMQYGVAALVSAIITARKVVDHERRISELERENERLKTEVEQLRLN